jgi:hypothetical protein
MKLVLTSLLVCIGIATASAQLTENSEDLTLGREFAQATTLIYRYTKAHNGAVPKNWSDVWDAAEAGWQYRFFIGRPMVHRQVAFVEPASQLTADGSGTRIIAISREDVPRPFGEKKKDDPDDKPVWVDHRLIVYMTKDGKLRQGSVDAHKPLRGVNLDNLVLKEPDLTNQQVADTITKLVNTGADANAIYAAFGAEAIEAAQKSGLLDPISQKVLTEKPPQLAATASTPQPNATATPTVAAEKPASSTGFPIVPVVILAVVIAGVAVFFIRRKS